VPSCLRVVRSASFRPRGDRYDPSTILRKPVRALSGGPDGLALALRVRAGEVVIDVLARGEASAEDADRAVLAGRGIAGVDDDPSAFLAKVADHPVLGELARRHDARLTRTPTLFESFTIAVVEQLVTTYEAWASIRRLTAFAAPPITGTTLRAPPTPDEVKRVPMWKLRALGIGSRRALTLHEGAKRGDALERLRALDPAEALERIQSLRGVGPWTGNMVIGAAMGWSDAVPVGDLHMPRIVTEALTGEPGGDEAMLAALEPFRPDRARAVKLLRYVTVRRGPLPRVDAHRRMPWLT